MSSKRQPTGRSCSNGETTSSQPSLTPGTNSAQTISKGYAPFFFFLYCFIVLFVLFPLLVLSPSSPCPLPVLSLSSPCSLPVLSLSYVFGVLSFSCSSFFECCNFLLTYFSLFFFYIQPTPHDANLAVKGILGVAAFGQLNALMGNTTAAKKYAQIASQYVQDWIQLANPNNTDHYRLVCFSLFLRPPFLPPVLSISLSPPLSLSLFLLLTFNSRDTIYPAGR